MIDRFKEAMRRIAGTSRDAKEFLDRATGEKRRPRNRRTRPVTQRNAKAPTSGEPVVESPELARDTMVSTPPLLAAHAPPTPSPIRPGEPLASATLVRLFHEQDRPDQAREMLGRLLREHPDDPELLELGLNLEAERSRVQNTPVSARFAEGGLRCAWDVQPADRQRAELILEAPSHLALRLIAYRGDEAIQRDLALSSPRGETRLELPADATCCALAIGLMGDHRAFASIAHLQLNRPTTELQPR